MRKLAVLLLMIGVLALTVACGAQVRESGGGGQGGGGQEGGGGQQGPIRLAVVPKAIGFDFWETVRQGAQCATSEHKNVSMQWDGVTAETDVTGQVNLLQNFITQGVDGLVYAATDAKVLSRVTKSALQQGITVVNIDSGTEPQPPEVPVFATDNVAAAKKVPDLLAKRLGKDGGKIAFIPFQRGTRTNEARSKGFKQGLKEHPELKLVAEQSSQSDFNTALRVTEDILTAHPDLDAIFAANEPGAVGAAEAIRNAGKTDEITVIGWDASGAEVKALKGGAIDALVVQNPFRMGYDGVNAAVRMIREGVDPDSEDTGATIVTRDNLNTQEVQALLNPSCENPPL